MHHDQTRSGAHMVLQRTALECLNEDWAHAREGHHPSSVKEARPKGESAGKKARCEQPHHAIVWLYFCGRVWVWL